MKNSENNDLTEKTFDYIKSINSYIATLEKTSNRWNMAQVWSWCIPFYTLFFNLPKNIDDLYPTVVSGVIFVGFLGFTSKKKKEIKRIVDEQEKIKKDVLNELKESY